MSTFEPPPPFRAWLATQEQRSDKIGDLARDAKDDHEWPRETNDLAALRSYLESHGAVEGALIALEDAFEEWEQITS